MLSKSFKDTENFPAYQEPLTFKVFCQSRGKVFSSSLHSSIFKLYGYGSISSIFLYVLRFSLYDALKKD
ncbi:hypothetical protein DB41_KQ00040 [Neochlamydia sp. TUME1]|nr:hypothetical protein DB41_KQ00040 [Neochlamydia sp. TUME1]